MPCWIVTLADDGFLPGAVALLHSVVRAGFTGTMVVGWSGSPAGAERLHQAVGKGAVRLLVQPADWSGTSPSVRKPEFLSGLASGTDPTPSLLYCDADMTWRCRWDRFERWLGERVLLVEDIQRGIGPLHPLHRLWEEAGVPRGLRPQRAPLPYVNGGFIFLPSAARPLLTVWQEAIRALLPPDEPLGPTCRGDRFDRAQFPDQDGLNYALRVWAGPVEVLGPDAMAFAPNGAAFTHAVGAAKPWRRTYWRDALRRQPPTLADKFFWYHVDGPGCPFSRGYLRWKRLDLSLGALLGKPWQTDLSLK